MMLHKRLDCIDEQYCLHTRGIGNFQCVVSEQTVGIIAEVTGDLADNTCIYTHTNVISVQSGAYSTHHKVDETSPNSNPGD